MAFTVEVKRAVYERAGGQCECVLEHLEYPRPPHPGGRCPDGHSQEFFFFVNKQTGEPGEESGKATDCIMLCSDCRAKFKTG